MRLKVTGGENMLPKQNTNNQTNENYQYLKKASVHKCRQKLSFTQGYLKKISSLDRQKFCTAADLQISFSLHIQFIFKSINTSL